MKITYVSKGSLSFLQTILIIAAIAAVTVLFMTKGQDFMGFIGNRISTTIKLP
jgi:hypothetical protein